MLPSTDELVRMPCAALPAPVFAIRYPLSSPAYYRLLRPFNPSLFLSRHLAVVPISRHPYRLPPIDFPPPTTGRLDSCARPYSSIAHRLPTSKRVGFL